MSTRQELSTSGRWFVGVLSAAGAVVLAVCLYHLATGRIDPRWFIVAGLTVFSASMTIKVPGIPARISVSETFVFTSVLYFGVSAGALTVAIDGLVASMWIHRRTAYGSYKTLFNVTAPAAALWVSAQVCFGLAGLRPVVEQHAPIEQLMPPLFVLAVLYFALNSGLTARAISFQTGTPTLSVWSGNFLWMAINFVSGASMSVLVLLLIETSVVRTMAMGIVIPLLVITYLTFKIAMGRAADTIAHLTELQRTSEERAALEAQLRESHKMESVGRLAAGVAHDFNNMLAPILGYADLLLDDTSEGHPHREGLLQIKMAAERARDLTRHLLVFGRKQILTLRPVDLRTVIAGFEKLLRRTLREDIRIDVSLPPALGLVRADVGQIEQVLMNLAVNAQDSMPEGGVFSMTLADVMVDRQGPASVPGVEPGSYVLLSAADTGFGMDADTLSRVCEPFFTTKGRGKGTGLGLSTVYGIVTQHGGNLAISSVPGRGSRFTIYLPHTSDHEAVADAGELRDESPAPRGYERILVVEDDASVRMMACQVLERQGYRVTSAESGEACLTQVGADTGTFDLLLTDIVMANMNGRALYDILAEGDPDLKVVYMSGYDDDVVTNRGVIKDGLHFIQKPFTPTALAREVRAALDATAAKQALGAGG